MKEIINATANIIGGVEVNSINNITMKEERIRRKGLAGGVKLPGGTKLGGEG